jgi:hypothetical protein
VTYEFKTRKPTGKPAWPLMLLAGAEKSGKSWAWAEFSASDLIGCTFVIPVGEVTVDEYGAIPGADFEIVEHDGTFNNIVNAAWSASRQPRADGKPNCLVIDSGTLIWDMLGAEQQGVANRREKAKQQKYGNRARAAKPSEEGGPVITMDQWNVAKARWGMLLDVLRKHDGPVIITARLEEVTVMDKAGNPTKEKAPKVRAEKNLPFDVTCIVEMPRRREAYLTGVVSTRLQLEPGDALKLPDFKIDKLLRMLGLEDDAEMSPRAYTPLSVDAYVAEEAASWTAPAQAQGYRQAPPAAAQQPRSAQQGTTPQAAPSTAQAAAQPATAATPQAYHEFMASIAELKPADDPGWRDAFKRAGTLQLRAIEVDGPDGTRVQLGKLLMDRMRFAADAYAAQQRESATAAAQSDSVPAGV